MSQNIRMKTKLEMCETFYIYIAVYYVLFSHGALLLFVVYVEIAFKCGYTYHAV